MKRNFITLSAVIATTTFLVFPSAAHAQYSYRPVVRGPVFNYGYAPMIRQPVPYGNVYRGFQSLPAPIYRSYGQFYQAPTLYNGGRAVIYTCCYPQRAY